MDNDKSKTMAVKRTKDLRTPGDLSALETKLIEVTVEAALNTEIGDRLSYPLRDA